MTKWKIGLMVVVIGTVFAVGCSNRKGIPKGTDWVKESVDKMYQNNNIQVNSISIKTKDDDSKEIMEASAVRDKKAQVYWMRTKSEVDSQGSMETETYMGIEDGQSYQIMKNGVNSSYTKQPCGDESFVKTYLEEKTIQITEKTKINVVGWDETDDGKYIKVELTTPDFERIQEKESVKAMYEEAKKNTSDKEQFQKVEEEYEASEEKTTVWFNEALELVKTKSDRTLSNRFLALIIEGYFDGMGNTTQEKSGLIKEYVVEEKFLVGDACEQIEVPTEYEEMTE